MAGYVVGFIGSKGGVGKSLLSANFSFAAALEYKQRVALIDFDQRAGGDQNLITGLKSPKSLKDFSEIPSVNQQSAQAFMAHHKLGVSFLSFSIDNDTVNLPSPEAVTRNIKALSQIFQLEVIDFGRKMNGNGVKVLECVNLFFVEEIQDLLF